MTALSKAAYGDRAAWDALPADERTATLLYEGPSVQNRRAQIVGWRENVRSVWLMLGAPILAIQLFVRPLPAWVVLPALALHVLLLLAYVVLKWGVRLPDLAPLLAESDNVHLVSLSLEAMGDADADARTALRDRLTKRLPDTWSATGQPLSDRARANLLAEVRRLRDREWHAPDIAFLTAVLICLDLDPARGIVPDPEDWAAIDEFRTHRHDPTVQAAVEDALLRLGRRP